jgi:hypothetical protein
MAQGKPADGAGELSIPDAIIATVLVDYVPGGTIRQLDDGVHLPSIAPVVIDADRVVAGRDPRPAAVVRNPYDMGVGRSRA